MPKKLHVFVLLFFVCLFVCCCCCYCCLFYFYPVYVRGCSILASRGFSSYFIPNYSFTFTLRLTSHSSLLEPFSLLRDGACCRFPFPKSARKGMKGRGWGGVGGKEGVGRRWGGGGSGGRHVGEPCFSD